MKPESATHSVLCKAAMRWLNQRCQFALSEVSSLGGEIPDALGYRDGATILIECKTSRSDFLADAKKRCRQDTHKGLGNYRLYLSPPDVIKPDDLPPKWGLLHFRGSKVFQVVTPYQFNSLHSQRWWFDSDREREMGLLVNVARRMRDGCLSVHRRLTDGETA